MLRHRFYYALKSYLPWGLRMGMRRALALRTRRRCGNVWPIDESAATSPAGWPGWPDGKKFAFVLTHDVEGPEGLAKCRRLAETEMELGFRSSFNFIPEGDYSVPPELRSWLVENGFEVGVHDLHHDGKLFSSRRKFAAKAQRINRYLGEWNAAGFRAGFMLRNLDWYHQLDVAYDASTFDTDPFEPQPDGAGTIFPFWVAAQSTAPAKEQEAGAKRQEQSAKSQARPCPAIPPRGYVELPYTLPQDSTLFLLLREKSPEIWLRKLDWVAAHGGMALVNVHPDYLRFPGEPVSKRTFPVEFYRELLLHVRDRLSGRYWQPLPRECARYAASLQPRPLRRRPRRVCMITHSYYASDNRVIRYADALVARGDHVDVLGLRRRADMPRNEIINGVNVYRLQDRLGKSEQGMLGYLWPLLKFFANSSWWLTRSHARRRYDLVHVHNIPDFLVFAAWYPKLTGTPVILDIHDIVPEFFANKFGRSKSAFMFRLLRLMENCSARFANHVIIANHLWLDLYATRTGTQGRCTPMINYVNANVFKPTASRRNDGRFIVIFPGGLQWHQGLDIALRAFPRVLVELPQTEFHIYGDGGAKDSLVALTRDLSLEGHVRFFEPVRVQEIAGIMAQADLGVVPKRADSFGNEAYSTKIMEFMSVGVPVVISSTKIDRYYFDDSVVRFFPSGDEEALARAIVDLLRDEKARQEQATRAMAYADRNSWSRHKAVYLELADRLCEKRQTK
jgi:glycosyltransferase involved in cell wall biosynthesis